MICCHTGRWAEFMEIGGIGDEFELIRTAFEAAGKAVPSAEDFARIGGASGTHLLKGLTQNYRFMAPMIAA